MTFKIEPLYEVHERGDFQCGESPLDVYIATSALGETQRCLTRCFVATQKGNNVVEGYYTLSNFIFKREGLKGLLSGKQFQKLRYQDLPATLLGKIAVHTRWRGKKVLGEKLLMHALYGAYEASLRVASYAVLLEPINPKVAAWYEEYGFIRLADSKYMYFPMLNIGKMASEK